MTAFPAYAEFDAYEHNKVCQALASTVTSQMSGGIRDNKLALKMQKRFAEFKAQAESQFAAAGSTLVVMEHLECDKDRMRKSLLCAATSTPGKVCMW
jgi:hypothetical protein